MHKDGLEKMIDDKILHPNEVWLIRKWRLDHRFSKLVIVIQDGVPMGIKKGIDSENPRDGLRNIK